MGTTIRRWSIALPRPRWTRRLSAPLENLTLEELAQVMPKWGRAEVRSGRDNQAWPRRALTHDDWILMERMGRPR
jgi:hypothetical protein